MLGRYMVMMNRYNHILSYFAISLMVYYILLYMYEIMRNKTFLSQRIAYSYYNHRTMWLDLH